MMKVVALASLLILAACSSHQTAGTTSETENELVRVVMPDGTPAVGARVTLMGVENFDRTVLDGEEPLLFIAQTNANGEATLVVPTGLVSYNLMAQASGLATLLQHPAANSTPTLHLDTAGALQGKAKPGDRIYLDGTGLYATSDSAGFYSLPNVPIGQYVLLLHGANGSSSFTGTVTITPADTTRSVTTESGTLIDDFDDGDANPAISALGAGGPWYLYDDMAGTTFAPAGVDSQPALAITATDAWQGRSLDLSVLLTSSLATPYGSIACKLGPDSGKGRADLSLLDSVSFMAKGTGTFRISFASDYIHTHYPPSQAYADLGYTFVAPDTWTRISIPVADLVPPPLSTPQIDGVQWSHVASHIDLLIFGTWDSPGRTVELKIDDIRLYGIPHTTFR